MRGRTLNNSFIILDEAQNTTPEQMKMFLTRIGFNSKVVVTGDVTQVDVPTARAACSASSACSRASRAWRSSSSALPTSSATASSPTSSPPTSAEDAPRMTEDVARSAPRRRAVRRGNAMEPPSLTVGTGGPVVVVGADEQSDVEVDVDRWCRLAAAVLRDEGRRGELTLTFVDRDEIADLNEQHLGKSGPTDVLSFPLDAEAESLSARSPLDSDAVPTLLGDVVICPDVARAQAPTHAGLSTTSSPCSSFTGCSTCSATTTPSRRRPSAMRAKELELLVAHHWGGPPPPAFRQVHE